MELSDEQWQVVAPLFPSGKSGPHRMVRNRRNPPSPDGRPLRRYRRRWKVERFFAWLFQFRRVVTRWEYRLALFRGFAHLACLLILLRQL